MAQLLPAGIPDPLESDVVTTSAIEYGTSWVFHFGDACACGVADPHLAVFGNTVETVTGPGNLAQWARTALSIERLKWAIYGAGFGSEFERLIQDDVPPDEVDTEIDRITREALLADPRIVDVPRVESTPSEDDPSSWTVSADVFSFAADLSTITFDLDLEG